MMLQAQAQLLAYSGRSKRQLSNQAALRFNKALGQAVHRFHFFFIFLAQHLGQLQKAQQIQSRATNGIYKILLNILSYAFGTVQPYTGVSLTTLLEIRTQAKVKPLLKAYFGNWNCSVSTLLTLLF
jgi:hypothetical protein